MARVLLVANQKGGVGKTTTAVTLSDLLARCGKRVLLVDLDAQGNCADALGLEKGPGLYELLFGELRKAVEVSTRPGLEVVLGDHRTAEARVQLAGVSFRERVLATRLAKIGAGYDVMVLDSAPGVDLLQISGLVACTDLLIPVELSHLSVVGAGALLGSVASLRKLGGFSGRLLGFLPTRWDRSTRESNGQLAGLRAKYEGLVWPPVPVDTRVREAARVGLTLWEYDRECRALRGAWVKQDDPEETVAREGGYFAVLRRLVGEWGLAVG